MGDGSVIEVFSGGSRATQYAERLLDGERGTIQALAIAAGFVRRDRLDPGLRRFVLEHVLGDVPGHDFWGEIQKCHEWARDRITYRRDPWGVERVADMRATLRLAPRGGQPEGDCLVKSVWLAGALAILGNSPAFAVIKQRREHLPASVGYKHVYVAVQHEGRVVPLDPTPEDEPPGWEAPHIVRSYYPIFGGAWA